MDSRLQLAAALMSRNMQATFRVPQSQKNPLFNPEEVTRLSLAISSYMNRTTPKNVSLNSSQKFPLLLLLSATALTSYYVSQLQRQKEPLVASNSNSKLLQFNENLIDPVLLDELTHAEIYEPVAAAMTVAVDNIKLNSTVSPQFGLTFKNSADIPRTRLNKLIPELKNQLTLSQSIQTSSKSHLQQRTELHSLLFKVVEMYTTSLFQLQSVSAKPISQPLQLDLNTLSTITSFSHFISNTLMQMFTRFAQFSIIFNSKPSSDSITHVHSPHSVLSEFAFLSTYLKYCLEAEAALDLPLLFPEEIVYNEFGAIVGINRGWYVPFVRSGAKSVAKVVVEWKRMLGAGWMWLFEIPQCVEDKTSLAVRDDQQMNLIDSQNVINEMSVGRMYPLRKLDSVMTLNDSEVDGIDLDGVSKNSLFYELRAVADPVVEKASVEELSDNSSETFVVSNFQEIGVGLSIKEQIRWNEFRMRGMGIPEQILWNEFSKVKDGDCNGSNVLSMLDEELW